MSVTELANQFNDEEGTGINTKMNYSRFYWRDNKFSRKIYHSAFNIPELVINKGTTLFTWFTQKFSRKIDDSINPSFCLTHHNPEKHFCASIDKSTTDKENIFFERVIDNGKNLIYKNSRSQRSNQDH